MILALGLVNPTTMKGELEEKGRVLVFRVPGLGLLRGSGFGREPNPPTLALIRWDSAVSVCPVAYVCFIPITREAAASIYPGTV